MSKSKRPESTVITIFGARGDLTIRKLIPALYNLYLDGHMPDHFSILCVDFVNIDQQAYRDQLLEGINEFSRSGKADPAKWAEFGQQVSYLQGDFQQDVTFTTLRGKIKEFEKANKNRGVRMFYFAVAPRFIETIADSLCSAKLCTVDTHHRIVVEKPFGTDLESARKLNRFLSKRFKERQIYHIDHYLGKEMVQNIAAFRFGNHVFEPLWSRDFIDHVQISVAEEVGVGKRGGYYDTSGALRDMIQNHLLQLLCLTAMDSPKAYEAEAIRDSKVKVLKQIRMMTPDEVWKNVVRAQYTAGEIQGQPRVGYRQEAQVSPDSKTETFVAARFFIDSKRWKGVPFFLRTGKSMPRQSSVIMIQFKDSPNKIFKDDSVPNRLVISIQPELEIKLGFESKVPGLDMKLVTQDMDFLYTENYSQSLPEAYETLLLDVMEGDATSFMRTDQIEMAWKIVMPILNAWEKSPGKQLEFYPAGSWGPAAADRLLRPYAKEWYKLTTHPKVAQNMASIE